MTNREKAIEECRKELAIIESLLKELENGGTCKKACDKAFKYGYDRLGDNIAQICEVRYYKKGTPYTYVKWEE